MLALIAGMTPPILVDTNEIGTLPIYPSTDIVAPSTNVYFARRHRHEQPPLLSPTRASTLQRASSLQRAPRYSEQR